MFETDQHGISRKGRETLIRRIAVSGGIQREHLPQFLSGIGEKIGEFVGGGAKVADAEAAGKGSEVKKNSAGSREFHFVTIRIRRPLRKS